MFGPMEEVSMGLSKDREVVHHHAPTNGGAGGYLNHHKGGEEAMEEVSMGANKDEDDIVSQEPQLQDVHGQHGGGGGFQA